MHIIITEKPDTISLDEIVALLRDAHMVNKEKGFELITARQSTEELKERLRIGTIYVALVENKLAGCCVLIEDKDYSSWFYNGPCAMQHLVGVRRDYQGMGLGRMLDERCIEETFKKYPIIIGSTSEKNERRLKIVRCAGYELVDFMSYPETEYYSVVYAKWKEGCPDIVKYRKIYNWRRFRCRLLRKADGTLRSCWKGIYFIYVNLLKK